MALVGATSKCQDRMSGSRTCHDRARRDFRADFGLSRRPCPWRRACGSPRDRRCARCRRLRSRSLRAAAARPARVRRVMMSQAMWCAREPCSRDRLDRNSGSTSTSAGGRRRDLGSADRSLSASRRDAGARVAAMSASRHELDDRVGRLGHAGDDADEMHAAMRQARPQRQRNVDRAPWTSSP